jgi:2-oxoglutarate ferredoxin oxidoreductase subunit alpha
MDVNIKVGGEAGFGIMASGLILVRTFSRGGLSAITINDYPSLIRGGHNVIHVRVSDVEIFATDNNADILIALNKETVDIHAGELNPGALIVFDEQSFKIDSPPPDSRLVAVPLMKLTKDAGGDVVMRNTVALGAALALIDYDFELFAQVVRDQFKKKSEDVINQNVTSARLGYEYVKKNFASYIIKKLTLPQNKVKQAVLTGNEGVALGAIAGGVKFFAAYPMTPISPLLAYMASVAEKAGFVYKQPEDEIAGINMAIGASFAGVRSMVATSGGGFSLMTEGASFAGMIETGVVIIYGQRPGPATGLPTWTTQGDLHFVLNAGQGEFPRLILAPGDVEEAYQMTAEAFNLADEYQTPTFVLVDKYICETYFTTSYDNLVQTKISIRRGKTMSEADQAKEAEVKRYLLTDDGISPRPIPGRKVGVFRANSDEHNELGYSIEDGPTTKRMIEKRMQKLYEAQKQVPEPVLYGPSKAKHTLVGWGSTKTVMREVLRQLKEKGKEGLINYLQISWINPFPADAVKRILSSASHVIDIEGNHNGQMADLILLKTEMKITDKILKYDGRPFFPSEIISYLEKLS